MKSPGTGDTLPYGLESQLPQSTWWTPQGILLFGATLLGICVVLLAVVLLFKKLRILVKPRRKIQEQAVPIQQNLSDRLHALRTRVNENLTQETLTHHAQEISQLLRDLIGFYLKIPVADCTTSEFTARVSVVWPLDQMQRHGVTLATLTELLQELDAVRFGGFLPQDTQESFHRWLALADQCHTALTEVPPHV